MGTSLALPRTKSEAPGAPDSASLGEDRKARQGDKVEGEGSYTGSRDYNQRTKKFVDSGKVDEAAREDPALYDPKKVKDDPNFPKK